MAAADYSSDTYGAEIRPCLVPLKDVAQHPRFPPSGVYGLRHFGESPKDRVSGQRTACHLGGRQPSKLLLPKGFLPSTHSAMFGSLLAFAISGTTVFTTRCFYELVVSDTAGIRRTSLNGKEEMRIRCETFVTSTPGR
jgi:hypothetical protein